MTGAASNYVWVNPNGVSNETRVVGMGEGGQVDKEMFLKLMIAQLKNQDPTSPMDQSEMMSSMTQFSQVEQMQNLTKAMETISLTQGISMIGKDVQYERQVRDDQGQLINTLKLTGTVESVEQTGGSLKLVLAKPEGAGDSVPAVRLSPSEVTKVFAS
jgi:flagellar basal-body rod modification protein FlgD